MAAGFSDNVEQLREALRHWQIWDVEYEALKEEVEAAPETSSQVEELHRIRNEFEGELLRNKEIDEIFRLQDPRPRNQILNVLQRRIDYVTRNADSLRKQLESTRNKCTAATVTSRPGSTDEDGGLITEIVEELDEDDNVISYSLSRPGDAVPHIRGALEKAGVEDLSDGEPESEQQNFESPPMQKKSISEKLQQKQTSLSEKNVPRPVAAPRKTVSFSEESKPEDAPTPASAPEMSRRAKRLEKIMKTAKEQESISKEKPVIPEDEDDEDAALWQQMLQFSMGEVAAVVAEIQLEESNTDEDFDSGDDDFDEEDDDAEDKYGRSTGNVVTEDYHQRMLELEKKLGVTSRFTQANEDEDDDSGLENNEGIGRIVVKHSTETPSSASRPAPPRPSIKSGQRNGGEKKGVRFAQRLDIASDDGPAASAAKEREPFIEPLGDIVERSGPSKPTEPKALRKPPRLKRAWDETASSGDIPNGPLDVPTHFMDQEQRDMPTRSPEMPTGPHGTILADQLVEREPTFDPAPPSEFDDSIYQNAVADEYHRMRTRFIQRQGGFLKENESPIQELDEAEGGPERMSRFKAARLSRQ